MLVKDVTRDDIKEFKGSYVTNMHRGRGQIGS